MPSWCNNYIQRHKVNFSKINNLNNATYRILLLKILEMEEGEVTYQGVCWREKLRVAYRINRDIGRNICLPERTKKVFLCTVC